MSIKNFSLSKYNLENFISEVRKLDLTKNQVANIEPKENSRTDQQNRLSHAWYKQLSIESPQNDTIGWKCFCKLHFGVPILRAEDDDFRKTYDSVIKSMTYEKKLEVMKILPVTSLMTTKQLSKYLDEMKGWFYTWEGINLEYPMSFFDEA